MFQADSLRAVLDSVFAAPDYRWVERAESFGLLRRWFRMVRAWLFDLRDANPALFKLVIAAMVIVVVAILMHAGWVLYRTLRAAQAVPEAMPADTAERRDQAWYRRAADALAADGRYAEAMQYDFLALVLALDAASLVRFHPSKTPAEYTREPGLGAAARDELGALVGALYGYLFARYPCGPGEFSLWRERARPERYASA